MNPAGTIADPLPQNCYTCHNIHQTYTEADWALTSQDPVTLWVSGATVDIGKGNQCINCHQARVPSPALPVPGEAGTINLTNKRYGPHHGAQGMAYTGKGGYEIGDGYSNSLHTSLVTNSCATCHMAAVDGGRETGGHTFRVISEGGDINTAGCAQCHSDAGALRTRVDDTQTEIAGLLNQLGTRLNELGLLDDDLEYAVTPQDFTSMQLGIIWNYQYVKEDKSLGVHNYKYIKTLLENSIAALN
jgi:formate-dependent nitrite reductase cytochrome c552 subunit